MSDVLSTPFSNVVPEASSSGGNSHGPAATETPFQDHARFPGLTSSPGTYGHNQDAPWGKPHSVGPDTIPCKFQEPLPPGRTDVSLNTPMSGMIPIKNLP
jgi:hypothetical protein